MWWRWDSAGWALGRGLFCGQAGGLGDWQMEGDSELEVHGFNSPGKWGAAGLGLRRGRGRAREPSVCTRLPPGSSPLRLPEPHPQPLTWLSVQEFPPQTSARQSSCRGSSLGGDRWGNRANQHPCISFLTTSASYL